MKRISIIGPSGSGKTTVARVLVARLDLPYLELDSVFHQPGWTQLDTRAFQDTVDEFIRQDRWIVDGNYTSKGIPEIVWPRADTLIWLDLPRGVTTLRAARRTLMRALSGDELWNGNREKRWAILDPRPEQNMALWSWTRSRPTRRKYEDIAASTAWDHLETHRLTTPAEVRAFLDQIVAERS